MKKLTDMWRTLLSYIPYEEVIGAIMLLAIIFYTSSWLSVPENKDSVSRYFSTLIIEETHAAEVDYVKQECKGIIDFVLPDRTRVDCLTDTHAIEYDFGPKWAEAVGQSLHYAANTGRRAGIVLIIPSKAQEKRLRILIKHYNLPIDLWVLRNEIVRFEDLPER